MNALQDYIHRVGRTARAGRSGVAISLVNQYELEWYIQIEKLIGMNTSCTLWAFCRCDVISVLRIYIFMSQGRSYPNSQLKKKKSCFCWSGSRRLKESLKWYKVVFLVLNIFAITDLGCLAPSCYSLSLFLPLPLHHDGICFGPWRPLPPSHKLAFCP